MSENRISLIVEGMEQNKGDIELDIFLSELKAFKKVLLKIDESIGKGKRLNQFSVVGLSHSSPATVELEVRPKKLENDLSEQVFYRFHEFIKTVDDRGVPRDSDIPILEELKKLISPIGRELATVSIKMNETEVVLSQDVSLYISKILESEDSCPTSVEGMLEQINVHKNRNVFTVYSEIGSKQVTCHFSKELLPKASEGLKKRVSVSGYGKFRKGSFFPYHIDVEEFEIFPPNEEIPPFQSLKGISPDATGDMLSEDFLKERRNEWE